MDHCSPVLFEEVAKVTIARIKGGEFNAQELANTVNAFGKMDHRSPVLFEEMAKAAIAMSERDDIHGYAFHGLLSPSWQARHQMPSSLLLRDVFHTRYFTKVASLSVTIAPPC